MMMAEIRVTLLPVAIGIGRAADHSPWCSQRYTGTAAGFLLLLRPCVNQTKRATDSTTRDG